MSTSYTLPKTLSLALSFRKLTLRFTHRLFDESLSGHFGLVSQFILSELYAGSELKNITAAFPFTITPIVERLCQFSLIQEDVLTNLGRHYAFCLIKIHGKEIRAWAHWGSSLKILLPAEAQVFTQDSLALENSLKPSAYDKWKRPFSFSRQEDIQGLLGFLIPEYTAANRVVRNTDSWQISAFFAHSDKDEHVAEYETEEKYCICSLQEGLDISHQTGIPLYLPSLMINTTYSQPEQHSCIPFEITPPPDRQEEICLLTGEYRNNSDSNPERNSLSAFKWPNSDWRVDIQQSLLQEDIAHKLLSRDVSIHTHWRRRNIASASVLSAFSYQFPTCRSWTPKFYK
jgi:hypothetical protein